MSSREDDTRDEPNAPADGPERGTDRPYVVSERTLENLWDDYDPVAVRAAIEAAAGTWADVDGDELIRYIYESRELGTKHRDMSWADGVWGEPKPERDLEAEWLGQWDEL